MEIPESMDELVYMTRREIGIGKVFCWVKKQPCPSCGKAMMGKPRDAKTGKPKIRAKEYICPECNHTVEKEEYEETLTAECKYTCPHCGKEGEGSVPFKRKKIDGVDTIRFQCSTCERNIDVTKKMKDKKEKK